MVAAESDPAAPARDPEHTTASVTIAPTASQKLAGLSKKPILKFMPITPASTTAGSRMALRMVSAFMTSFERWAEVAM